MSFMMNFAFTGLLFVTLSLNLSQVSGQLLFDCTTDDLGEEVSRLQQTPVVSLIYAITVR